MSQCTGAAQLGSMAALFPGISLTSASATWIVRLAIPTYTDLPEDPYLAYPVARRKRVYDIQNRDLGGWIDVYCCIPNRVLHGPVYVYEGCVTDSVQGGIDGIALGTVGISLLEKT